MNEDSDEAQLIQNNAQRQVSEFTFIEYLRFRCVLTNGGHSFSYKDEMPRRKFKSLFFQAIFVVSLFPAAGKCFQNNSIPESLKFS